MRPTHMLRENRKPLQNPNRDSLWHHHLAGRVLLFSFPQLPLWECVIQRVAGSERGRTHLRGGERGCLPEPCRAPQLGQTPLHWAAVFGNAAVVEKLLAAGAAADAKAEVRGEWDADRGWVGVVERSSAFPFGFLVLCFSKFGF